jgi:hypothetical protein
MKKRYDPKRSHQTMRSFFRHFVELKMIQRFIMTFSVHFDQIFDRKHLYMRKII